MNTCLGDAQFSRASCSPRQGGSVSNCGILARLISFSKQCLSDDGRCSIVIDADDSQETVEETESMGIWLAHHHEIIGKTSRRRTKQVQKCSKYLKFHVRLLYFWLPFSDFSFYLGSCEELWDITGFIINYEYMRRWWPDFLIRHVGDGDHGFWFRKVVCWMFACCLVYVTSLRTWQYGSFEVTSCAGY